MVLPPAYFPGLMFANRPVVWYTLAVKTIGIFEVKTRISEIFGQVKETGEPIVVTRRGQPMVKIVPADPPGSEVWLQRESYLKEAGPLAEELDAPSRSYDTASDLPD